MNMNAYPPASAPPADMFGNVPGYEGIGGGGFLPPPPPPEPIAPPQPGSSQNEWSIPSISEEEAHEAFKSFASGHCCWSSAPAKDGVITGMQPFNTYRYRLETYTESRSTDWSQKPYEGEASDFYTQPAPRPWEVPATPPNHFTDHTRTSKCLSPAPSRSATPAVLRGPNRATPATATGRSRAGFVTELEPRTTRTVTTATETGSDRCDSCSGRGTSDCDLKNQVEDHVVHQESGLDPNDLKNVHGKELFKNNNYLLYPVVGFPNPSISEASERMIRDHQSKYAQNARILQQRQTVELIPISKVSYKWKGDIHVFYVYGNERQVSADYPATCCCASCDLPGPPTPVPGPAHTRSLAPPTHVSLAPPTHVSLAPPTHVTFLCHNVRK
ncbi:hypothetical protein WMY93_033317 [Mugilogobius chulae]|uniref:Uncharacterized protein n=1 Tax=Mugilogobius chulae TaxID=88201 RepID=A0AAW0MHI4_9GOBI